MALGPVWTAEGGPRVRARAWLNGPLWRGPGPDAGWTDPWGRTRSGPGPREDGHIQLVARVGGRFMLQLKTESEVATINYLIKRLVLVPVPTIYHYNSNPFNRLGGEWILMSKVCFNLLITQHSSDCHIFPGAALSQAYHGLAYNSLVKLLKNLAAIIIAIISHCFSEIGSLYFGPNPRSSGFSTPKALPDLYSEFPFSPTLAMSTISYAPYLETKV